MLESARTGTAVLCSKVVTLLAFASSAGFIPSADAAPNIYQALESIDQYEIVKVVETRGNAVTVKAPVDLGQVPVGKVFALLDAGLTKKVGTLTVNKVQQQGASLYTANVKMTVKGGRVARNQVALLASQSDDFLELARQFKKRDRQVLMDAMQGRFKSVKIDGKGQEEVWLPGKDINPILDLRLGFEEARFNAVSLILDSSAALKPRASSTRVEGFIPHVKRQQWLNSVGFGLTFTQVDRYNLNFVGNAAGTQSKARIDSEQSDFRVIAAPRFQLPWPSRISLAVSIFNKEHTIVDLERTGAPATRYSVDRQGMRVEGGFEYVLLRYLRVGYGFIAPIAQKLVIETVQSDFSSEIVGRSVMSKHALEVGLQYPWLAGHLYTFGLGFVGTSQSETFSFDADELAQKTFEDSLLAWTVGASIALNL